MFRHPRPFQLFRPIARPGHLRSGLCLYAIILTLFCQVFTGFTSVSAAINSADNLNRTSIASTTPVSAAQNANNFYFTDFEADYYLSRAADGTSRLRVVERLTAVFPDTDQNHGITRVIPYTNQDGHNLTIADDRAFNPVVRHNGESEAPAEIERSDDGYYVVYLGDADTYLHGTHTYELEYEFQHVITAFSDQNHAWQELYWDTNGNDWQQSFGEVTARVHFADPDLAAAFTGQAWCYVGRYGSNNQQRCTTTTLSDGLSFTATNLTAGENLTFDLEFAPDTFVIPAPTADYRPLIVLIAEVIILIALSLYLVSLYRRVQDKRTAYRDTFVKPEYTPPRGFKVADLAENYLHSSQLGSSSVATLLEMAVHHQVTLIQHQTDSFLGRKQNTWTVKINSLDLTAAEVATLKILAGNTNPLTRGQEITIKSHRATNSLIQLGRDFHRFTRDHLRTLGCLETSDRISSTKEPKIKNPCTTLSLLLVAWIFLGSIGFVLIFDTAAPYHPVYPGEWIFIAIFALFLLTFFVGLISTIKLHPYFTHTIKGLQYSRYLDGLKLYIKMAEADRLQFLQSVQGADTSPAGVVKLYEKLLPYAVLFRLEESWLQELAHYYEQPDLTPPTWYVGVGVFSAHEFSRAITAASRSIGTAATHSTASSSSSGSSGGGGGGFSGGGGGGGGGGGW